MERYGLDLTEAESLQSEIIIALSDVEKYADYIEKVCGDVRDETIFVWRVMAFDVIVYVVAKENGLPITAITKEMVNSQKARLKRNKKPSLRRRINASVKLGYVYGVPYHKRKGKHGR
ncbi:MAG: hypothetical protein U5N55_01615 [Cypionkella sp.]|nr:hypothetical protein [Cypionkella sp.]